MLPRLSKAIGLACLAVLCFAIPIACSSSQRRDQYYGTNEGADYQPEAGVFGDAEGDADDGGDMDAEEGSDASVAPDKLSADAAAAPDVEPDAAAAIVTPCESDPNTVP